MAYFTGQVAAKDLYSTVLTLITQVQAGQSSAWWKKESSLEADGVYTSQGSSGNERIVLVLRPGTSGHFMVGGMARDYTPAAINTAGAFDTLSIQNVEYFTSAQNENVQVSYDLSVTPDRIILHVQGDKFVTTWANGVIFLGIPYRYDPSDKKCIVHVASEDNAAGSNVCRVVEDSINRTLVNYTWYFSASPGNPSWGNNIFLETFHFGITGEGLRGEIDGLYGSHSDGLVDGNIIDVSGVSFKVIKRISNGNNGFPRECVLMRMT